MQSRRKQQSPLLPQLRAVIDCKKSSTFQYAHRYLCIQSSNYRTDILDRRDAEVGPGSCKIAHAHGRMIARNLSSELLLVLYADKCKLGKMVRFYDDPVQTAFAETALGMFFKELPGLGLQKSDLRLHAIGGLTATSRCFTYMRRWLRSVNIPLAGTDLATDQARSVWLVLDSGHLIVRSATRTIAAIRPMQPKQLAS